MGLGKHHNLIMSNIQDAIIMYIHHNVVRIGPADIVHRLNTEKFSDYRSVAQPSPARGIKLCCSKKNTIIAQNVHKLPIS